jgi:hypothetical protein
MFGMSMIQSRRPVRQASASIPQVVAGALVTLVVLFTVQMSALTAWVDSYGAPGGLHAERVDELGRPFTGWSQTWHTYGPLLWALYAIGLLAGLLWLWRTILTQPRRAVWGIVLLLVAASAVFWGFNLDRFSG